MSNEFEEQVPGVTFWFKGSQLEASRGKEKFNVHLTLNCQVNDEELWKGIERKFQEGFRVFASVDFHGEVMDVMRSEMTMLDDRCRQLERDLRASDDAYQRLKEEHEKLTNTLGAFGQALRGRDNGG